MRDELPGGRIVLVVSFGPRMDVDGRTYTSFAAGLHDVPAHTEHDGLGHGIQAYLTPLGARRLLGMPMGELTRQVVDLEDLIGRGAGELAERLATAPGWADADRHVRAGDRGAGAARAEPVAPELEWAWQRLVETDGAAPIGALGEELGWSRRHLAARFREELGMPPKAVARMLRFERAVERLRAGDDLADAGARQRLLRPGALQPRLPRVRRGDADRAPSAARPLGRRVGARPARCRRTARAGRPARW